MERHMNEQHKHLTSPPGGATPKLSDEAEHLFDDLFVTPPPLAPGQADTSYVHHKAGFFSRLFKKNRAPETKKAA